jgi:hypothetical protein
MLIKVSVSIVIDSASSASHQKATQNKNNQMGCFWLTGRGHPQTPQSWPQDQ